MSHHIQVSDIGPPWASCYLYSWALGIIQENPPIQSRCCSNTVVRDNTVLIPRVPRTPLTGIYFADTCMIGTMISTASLMWKVVSPFLIVMGTIGNLLCITVLTRPSNRKSSTAIFLTALAVSDLIVIYTGLLRWWLIHLNGTDVRHLGDAVCRIHWFLIFASTENSSWILVAVTCERIISTRWPHKVKVICTPKTATYTVLLIYLIIYGGSMHLLYGMELKLVHETDEQIPVIRDTCNSKSETFRNASKDCYTDSIQFSNYSDLCNVATIPFNSNSNMCSNSNNQMQNTTNNCATESHLYICNCSSSQGNGTVSTLSLKYSCSPFAGESYSHFFSYIYPWMDLVLYFLIPAIILGIGDILIIHRIISSRRLRLSMMFSNKLQAKQLTDKSISITVMLITVNAVFIFCTTPVSVFLIGMPYWVDDTLGFTEKQEIAWAAVNLLMYLNHSINFILYFLSGSRFRKKVIKTFKRVQHSPSRQNSSIGSLSGSFRTRNANTDKTGRSDDNSDYSPGKSLSSVLTRQSTFSNTSFGERVDAKDLVDYFTDIHVNVEISCHDVSKSNASVCNKISHV